MRCIFAGLIVVTGFLTVIADVVITAMGRFSGEAMQFFAVLGTVILLMGAIAVGSID